MGLLETLSPILLGAAAAAPQPCQAIPGWDQIVSRDELRWIVIGEIHGSNEIPDIFADAVCLAAASRPVVVALEQPSVDQARIDAFLASDGGEASKLVFLDAVMWNMPMKDGRSSEAYFRLFDTLRQMKAAGRIEGVVAFQPSSFTAPPTPAEYEREMAELLQSAAGHDEMVIALVGNVHAMRTEVPFQQRYMAMAGNLPETETVTLNVIANGGSYWNCTGGPDQCGVKPSYSRGEERQRGVQLNSDESGPYSGVIYLGTATTASFPQGEAALESN